MTSYRILECAGCGQVVASFGDTRVLWPSGEAHRCSSVDDLDDITAQALAGQRDLDYHVAEAVEALLLKGDR